MPRTRDRDWYQSWFQRFSSPSSSSCPGVPASRAASVRREVVQVRTLRAGNRYRLRDWTVFVRAVVAAPAAFERVPAEGRGVVVAVIIVFSRSFSVLGGGGGGGGVSRDAAVPAPVVVDPLSGGGGGPVVSHDDVKDGPFFFESGPKKRGFFLFRVCVETLNRELEKRKKDETLINTLSLTETRKEEEEEERT